MTVIAGANTGTQMVADKTQMVADNSALFRVAFSDLPRADSFVSANRIRLIACLKRDGNIVC